MRDARWIIGALVYLAIGSLGCLNIVDGRYGKACEVDDDCGISSTRECLGGYCSGLRCNFESSKCERNQVCVGEQSGLISNARCFEECESDEDCPETWHCSGEVCKYSSYSHGEIVTEMTRVATGEELEATLVIGSSAGTPASITWYIQGYGEAEKQKVSGPSDDLTHAYIFEKPGLYELDATFEDANGVIPVTSEERIFVCGREGDPCDEANYASCCDGTYCMSPSGQSEGICSPPP